jgi:hypothetical protein
MGTDGRKRMFGHSVIASLLRPATAATYRHSVISSLLRPATAAALQAQCYSFPSQASNSCYLQAQCYSFPSQANNSCYLQAQCYSFPSQANNSCCPIGTVLQLPCSGHQQLLYYRHSVIASLLRPPAASVLQAQCYSFPSQANNSFCTTGTVNVQPVSTCLSFLYTWVEAWYLYFTALGTDEQLCTNSSKHELHPVNI